MANSRDFTGKNRKFTGTKGIVTPKGTTGQRVGEESGELRFNTTTELMEYYDGTQWKPIDAPPTISGITTNDAIGTGTVFNADGSTLFQITINGGNFSVGCTVKFIGDTGTEYVAGNVTRVSASQITCNTIAGMGTSDDPYDVRVNNTSGLSATLDDAFSYNSPPTFVSAAGSLGSVFDGLSTSKDCSATDAEGNTITYSLASGSLPGSGLSLSSSTGLITGTLSGSPAVGTYSFTVQAATTEGNATRNFSVDVVELPTGGTVTTSGNFRIHTFTSSGTFTNTVSSLSVQYLVIGGGAGSRYDNSGGGGAGGYRTNVPGQTSGRNSSAEAALILTTGNKTVTVGGGGAGGPNSIGPGNNGENSVFDTITALGGGGGGAQNVAGSSGGSGGGDGHSGGPLADRNTGGTGTAGQGFDGGGGRQGPTHPAGGGGGAGGNGGTPPDGTSPGGAGGVGLSSTITGSSVTRAGGGSGSSTTPGGNRPSPGGGGGFGSGINVSPGGNGDANTGGGGGGGSDSSNGGNGGSGIVIVRYDTSEI